MSSEWPRFVAAAIAVASVIVRVAWTYSLYGWDMALAESLLAAVAALTGFLAAVRWARRPRRGPIRASGITRRSSLISARS